MLHTMHFLGFGGNAKIPGNGRAVYEREQYTRGADPPTAEPSQTTGASARRE